MSYRIEYDGSVGKYEVRKVNSWRFPLLCFAAVCGFLLSVCAFAPQGREAVRSFLIPGEDAVTVLAFRTMTDDLRSGAGVYRAFYDFCRTVIHGA